MFQRLEDIYKTQARQALKAGCGGKTVYNFPVDLEPIFESTKNDSTWFSSIKRLITHQAKEQNVPIAISSEYCLSFLQLRISEKDDTTPASAEQFLIGLGQMPSLVAFEIIGDEEQTVFQFVCKKMQQIALEGFLSVQYPNSQIITTCDDALSQSLTNTSLILTEYNLRNYHAYMLKTFTSFKGTDPLSVAIGVLEELPIEGFGAVQIIFRKINDQWRDHLRRISSDPFDPTLPALPEEADLVACTAKKTDSPFFAVAVRLLGSDHTVIERLEGFLSVFGNHKNQLIRTSSHPQTRHKELALGRITYRHGMLLNATELAGLVHLPSTSIRAEKLQRTGIKTKALPTPFRNRTGSIQLGINQHRGKNWQVQLTEEELTRHLYCCGVSGTGKSTFLLNTVLQLIHEGYGVAVLDPHGDLVEEHILPRIPPHRRQDVIWFDPSDDVYPIGFNILAADSEDERDLLAEDLVSIFKRTTTGWGPRLETLLAYAILAIVGSKQGGTLTDLRQFLADPSVRKTYLTHHPDQDVQYFWDVEFPSFPKNAVGPVQTRLNAFLRRRRIRNIVGQKHNSLPFRKMMDESKIFLGKLSQGAIGESNSYLLGSLLCARFQQTAMMRQNVSESQRRTFVLVIDEFHNFICRSMEAILSGARKYHLGLCLAHQEMQWSRDKEVAASVLANPYTRICFRVGDTDAKYLSEGFGSFGTVDLQNLSRGQALIRLDRSDFTCNLETLPPPPHPENGKQIAQDIIEMSRRAYGTPIGNNQQQSPTHGHTPTQKTISDDDFYA